jgi:dihydroorotate dehydrogenase electron transfer subunit
VTAPADPVGGVREAAAAGPIRLDRPPLAGREPVGRATWLLHFEAPALAAGIEPGQFLMVGVHPPTACAYLKRPFSVADVQGGRLTLLLRAYGRGTLEMAERRIGDRFELLGPFGTAFRLASPARRAVLVAGGIGLAPFYLLARRLKSLPHPPETVLVYGERTTAAVTRGVESFPFFDRVEIVTEDGSGEGSGNVVDAFRRLAREGLLAGARLCACGPRAMLEALEVERERLGVPAEYSLEERMACGYGICQGCAVPASRARRAGGAYRLLCLDGPVMDPAALAWPHQALP